MRISSKTFTVTESTSIQKAAATETISRITENKLLQSIEVYITYESADGIFLAATLFTITGVNYDLLMSESPSFAPGKPANEYREDDLWYIIDLMEA